MEAPNLENHCFSGGKTYFLRNPLFLYFAQKVIKNSIKKGTKIHEKTIKKTIRNRSAEKYQKRIEHYRKRAENGAQKGPKRHQKRCRKRYLKKVEISCKKLSQNRTPWNVLTDQKTVLELLNQPTQPDPTRPNRSQRSPPRLNFNSANRVPRIISRAATPHDVGSRDTFV